MLQRYLRNRTSYESLKYLILLDHPTPKCPWSFLRLSPTHKRNGVRGMRIRERHCVAYIQQETLKNTIQSELSQKTLKGAQFAEDDKRHAVFIFCREVLQINEEKEIRLETAGLSRKERRRR